MDILGWKNPAMFTVWVAGVTGTWGRWETQCYLGEHSEKGMLHQGGKTANGESRVRFERANAVFY